MKRYSVYAASIHLPCPHCHSQPGQKCLTRTGRKAEFPHQQRYAELGFAFGSGFEDGWETAIRRAAKDPSWLQAEAEKIERKRKWG